MVFDYSGVEVTEKSVLDEYLWDQSDIDEDDDLASEGEKWSEDPSLVGAEYDHTEDDPKGVDLEETSEVQWGRFGESRDELDAPKSCELNTHNQVVLLARGGKPGLGNFSSKGSVNTLKSRKPTLV